MGYVSKGWPIFGMDIALLWREGFMRSQTQHSSMPILVILFSAFLFSCSGSDDNKGGSSSSSSSQPLTITNADPCYDVLDGSASTVTLTGTSFIGVDVISLLDLSGQTVDTVTVSDLSVATNESLSFAANCSGEGELKINVRKSGTDSSAFYERFFCSSQAVDCTQVAALTTDPSSFVNSNVKGTTSPSEVSPQVEHFPSSSANLNFARTPDKMPNSLRSSFSKVKETPFPIAINPRSFNPNPVKTTSSLQVPTLGSTPRVTILSPFSISIPKMVSSKAAIIAFITSAKGLSLSPVSSGSPCVVGAVTWVQSTAWLEQKNRS